MPMISLDESIINFADAAKLLPQRRKGKKPHIATLYRWASSGFRGVRLETIRIGGTLCTSREALDRFFAALTLGDQKHRHAVAKGTRRAVSDVEARLDAAGL